jgi:hypothetical protein
MNQSNNILLQFVVLAMVAGVAVCESESESQLSTVDSSLPYNNVPAGSRPTGFYYSVQVKAQQKYNLIRLFVLKPQKVNKLV